MYFSELDLLSRFPFNDVDGACLVDVGAHKGGVTARFARRGWRAIAFEPEPGNRAALLERIQGLAGVTVLDRAVSDVAGQEVPFYTSADHSGIHSLKPFHESHQPAGTVTTVRLDEALAELDVPVVTLLKIDIEGADFLALRSFDFDRYRPEVVMVEFMDSRSSANFGYTHHDMAAFMAGHGYKTYVSEWSSITHYASATQPTGSHFLQLAAYPLDHEPAWGNLIFVQNSRTGVFDQAAAAYQVAAARQERMQRLPGYRLGRGLLARLARLPGLRAIRRRLQR